MAELRLNLINLWETLDAASHFSYTKFVVFAILTNQISTLIFN